MRPVRRRRGHFLGRGCPVFWMLLLGLPAEVDGVVVEHRDHAADLVLPSKLSGMLASGRPVIAACRAVDIGWLTIHGDVTTYVNM